MMAARKSRLSKQCLAMTLLDWTGRVLHALPVFNAGWRQTCLLEDLSLFDAAAGFIGGCAASMIRSFGE